MNDLVEVLKTVATALGTVAALGAFVGGTGWGFIKGYRKLTGNGGGKPSGASNPFSAAAEHQWRADVIKILGEIRDAHHEANGDHRVMLARLEAIERQR